MTRLVTMRCTLGITTTIIALEAGPPGRTLVDRLLCVVSSGSKRLVYAVLTRTLLREDLGTSALRLGLWNIVATRTAIVSARSAVVTPTFATRTLVVTAVELARATVIPTVELARATVVTARTSRAAPAIISAVELARASRAAPSGIASVELARAAIITSAESTTTAATATTRKSVALLAALVVVFGLWHGSLTLRLMAPTTMNRPCDESGAACE